MKILVFSPYYPPHTGGLESHSEEFNKYLSQKGITITVFTPRLPIDALEKESPHDKIHVIRFPAFEIISNYPLPKIWLPSFWRLFLPLFSGKYDLVISRTRFFFSSFIALIFAKITRTKLLHIEHGSDFVRLSSGFTTFFAKLYDHTFGWLVFRCSDLTISISGAVQKFVQKFDKRFSPIIYRGLDFQTIDAVEPNNTMKQKYPEKIIISTAARLYRWKGIEYSIAAIRSLPDEIRSKIVFLIIGMGEDYDRLKKLSENLPIEMLGNLSRPETIAILKSSDIYIHSSFSGGGLSTALLEAMYSRCAAIATKNEGADEVITDGESGLLIDTPDATRIAKNIELLITDTPKRTHLSEIGRTTVFQKFGWSKSIEQYLEIFKTL